jgi:hypothetical protein
MIRQSRNETDDGIREPKAYRNQIRVGDWRQFHQPINTPAHLLDDAFVSERIKHIARNAVRYGLAHPKLPASFAKYFY